MKIGIISDVHRYPEGAAAIIARIHALGIVDRLILNGDIGESGENFEESVAFSERILHAAGETGLETYVQPGSHEALIPYQYAIDTSSARYSNLIDCLRTPCIDVAGRKLIFLPGSDIVASGQFHLGSELASGRYIRTEFGTYSATHALLQRFLDQNIAHEEMEYRNIGDLETMIQDPARDIVICHVPARFDVGPQGVDFAYFATSEKGLIPGVVLEAQIQAYVQREHGRNAHAEEVERIAQGNGYTFHRENVGNKALRDLFDRLGVRYAINGHIHESGHHAHDRDGNPVPDKTSLSELFWNSGCFDQGQMGILTLDDTRVSYHNVSLTSSL